MATVSIRKVWTFQSDTNSSKTYETLQYVNGSTSCNCFGWTRRIQNGIRTCKHTRYVDQGVAEQYCLSSHSYAAQEEPVKKIILKTVNKSGGRKIVW